MKNKGFVLPIILPIFLAVSAVGALVYSNKQQITDNLGGGSSTITPLPTYKVKVSSNDTTQNFLGSKLVAGTGITITENNNGGNETLTFDASGGGSGTVGPGTINQIAYFDSTSTVASLATSTYPNLTELSYVKGVTSAIQTQLDARLDGSLTATRVPFASDSNTLTDSANFRYDTTDDNLILSTAAGSGGIISGVFAAGSDRAGVVLGRFDTAPNFFVGYQSRYIVTNSSDTIFGWSNAAATYGDFRAQDVALSRVSAKTLALGDGLTIGNASGTLLLASSTISGGLTLSALSDGCLETSSGLVTSTGVSCGSGGGTPAGSSGQIQYNDSGAFGATTTFAISPSGTGANVLDIADTIQLNNPDGTPAGTLLADSGALKITSNTSVIDFGANSLDNVNNATLGGDLSLTALSDGCLYTSSGQVLSTASPCGSGGGGMAIADPVTGGTDGSVLFVDAGDLQEDNANFFWNNTTNRLGIATTTPFAPIHVYGNSSAGLQLLAGAFGLQSAADDNGFVTINAYYDGAIKRIKDGAGGYIQFAGGNLYFAHFGSGTAGSSASIVYSIFGSSAGYVGIGNQSPAAMLDVNSTNASQPVIISRGASGQTGDLTQWQNNSSTVLSRVKANGDLEVPDEVYGAGWDTSLEVPTKNALYDKIQTLISGVSIGDTITSGTAGSALFLGTSNVLQQDNANYFWDDTNNYLGLGLATPAFRLNVQGTTLATAGARFTRVSGDAFSGTLDFRKARGTVGSETVVSAADILMRLQASGYDGSAYDSVGTLNFSAESISGGIVAGAFSIATANAAGTLVNGLNMTSEQKTGFGVTPAADSGRLVLGGNVTSAARANAGAFLNINNVAITATDTTSSGTVTNANTVGFFGTAFAASSATTYTNANTLYIGGAPTASTNVTITNPWAIYVNGGNSHFAGGIRTASYLQSTNAAGVAFLIYDGGANEMLRLVRTTSAVNEHTLTNAATGANPQLSATGGDTNVGLDFLTKAAGVFRLLGNSTQAAELRLLEDTDNGTNYTAFKVGTQAGDVTYTLPTADGTSGYVLSTNGSGTLSWVVNGAGGSGITRSIIATSTDFTPATTASTDYVYMVDNTAANVTITMPTAVGNTNRYTFVAKDVSATFGLIFNTTSGQTISTNASGVVQVLGGTNVGATALISDGANWWLESVI